MDALDTLAAIATIAAFALELYEFASKKRRHRKPPAERHAEAGGKPGLE